MKKIEGYSIKRLIIILLFACYLDSISTLIGFNMGLHETNQFINYFMQMNSYIVLLYPLLILFVVSIFYFLLKKWKLALQIGYIFIVFQFVFAFINNVFIILI